MTNDQQYIEERYSFFGDLRYFEKEFVEEEIQKILSNNDLDFKAQSKDIAKILYDVIGNIGNTCRREVNLKKLRDHDYKYDHVMYSIVNKYMKKIRSSDAAKIRASVNKQFVHRKILDIPLAPTLKNLGVLEFLTGLLPEAVAETIITIPHVKAYESKDMVEALRHYKIVSITHNTFVDQQKRDANKYYYDITKQVLADMLKIYDMT